jgi:hypothetical protein
MAARDSTRKREKSMTNYGVFRDDFYNSAAVLTEAAATLVAFSATGVLPAAAISGARDNIVALSGTSQTFTTDTAANIIAAIQAAIQTAYKANVGGFASSLGGQPPMGPTQWPNFFNFSWILELNTAGTVTGVTFAGGTGVTVTAIGALAAGLSASNAASATNAKYVCQVTGPASVTMTRVQ